MSSMATPSILSVSFCLCFSLLCWPSVYSFSPVDNYLVDCGSSSKVFDADNRLFIGDSSPLGSVHFSRFFTTTRTISLRDRATHAGLPPIYHTARLFKRPSKYTFAIRDRGIHLVRLHFRRFDSSDCDFDEAQFHVWANRYLLLNNFTIGSTRGNLIKDYMIWIDGDKLEITFTPVTPSKIAFCSAIEVISAPKDLIADIAQFVNPEKNERISGLMRNSFETVYRLNVGGKKVTPFNDSLWRTWTPDDNFIKLSVGYEKFYFGGRIRYQAGGASREVAPDNVYNTARLIRSSNNLIPKVNLTWEFPVDDGYNYLVRMHFCDIASMALGLLRFNVYVNGNLAYENLDLTSITNGMLASPFYADFVVERLSPGALVVSVGPSNESLSDAIDAILNGVEIMKMNNSMGSLDGKLSVDSLLRSWPGANHGALVPLIAAVCLLLIASVIVLRGRLVYKDSTPWSRLPTSVAKADMTRDSKLSVRKT